jgi:PIN domain nuclease of toxin-antitoxin system
VVLAVLYEEVGNHQLVDYLREGLLSSVNLLEVHTKLLLNGLPADLAWRQINGLQLEICPLDVEQARIASEMIWKTRPYGLSLGDRACLALAVQRRAMVYTADRVWSEIPLGVKIEVIR